MNKKNKTTLKTSLLIAIIFAFMIALIAPLASATASLTATLSKYEPYPAVQGQSVKVWISIQNIANEDAKNVKIELTPSYPFTLYGESANKTIVSLGGNKDYLLDYTLKVDENALQGNNNLKGKMKFTTGNYVWEQEFSLDVFIQSRDATVAISSVQTDPLEIQPGQNGKITITVTNNAPTALTDLNMKLYLYTTSGSTLTDLPFAPIDSTTEIRKAQLNPQESIDFEYTVRAYPDATSKIYKVPFVLTYYDILGNQKNKTDVIGVVVNSRPDVVSVIDKTDLSQQKKTGSLTLKFINKGLNDIKFLNVKLEKSSDYDLLSTTDTTYIGNLVSDDYQTAEYKLDIKSSEKTINIPVLVQYRDSNNKYYEEIQNVKLNLIDSGKLDQANNEGGTSAFTIIIIVMIIAGAVFWYFKKKTTKNKKGQF